MKLYRSFFLALILLILASPVFAARQTILNTGTTWGAEGTKIESNFVELYQRALPTGCSDTQTAQYDTATGLWECIGWDTLAADDVTLQILSGVVSIKNVIVGSGTTPPGTCSVGQLFWDTDADTDGSLLSCRATNTWKDVDDDGGGGGLASTDIDTSAEIRAIVTDEQGSGALLFAGGNIGAATATTPSAGDNDTSVATTAFVQGEVQGSRSGTHASPSTTSPLSPTWTGPMHTVWYGAAGTINLPAAANYGNRGILIYNTGAFTVTIDSNGSEVIVRDGTAQTGGVSMTLSSGAGNYVSLISDGTRWITLGYKGTLSVGS